LERLRLDGYEIFHDLVGDGFNIDHALIGPAGVFTVETKTWSKPIRGEARIRFDGESVTRKNLEPERKPITQAKAQARWLKTLLTESSGRDFQVRPVIVFPGWFIERSGRGPDDIWVLEPKALPSFLQHEQRTLTAEDVKLASFHLAFVRVGERERAS
jgi:hypothetical protein